MNFWIAVVVFCANGECAFWKSDENFYSEKECQVSAFSFMNKVEEELPLQFLQGVCLPVKTKDQI